MFKWALVSLVLCVAGWLLLHVINVICFKAYVKQRKHYLRSTRWLVAGFKRPRPGRESLN